MYIPPILMVNNELAADFAKTVNFLFDAINLKEAATLSNLDESTYENSLFFSYINTVFSYGDAAGTLSMNTAKVITLILSQTIFMEL